jgi:HEAT repeat protein
MQSWWMTRFGVLEHPAMTDFLILTLQTSPSPNLRKCAAVALRDGKRPDAIEPLLALALDTDEPVELRGEAFEALAYQGNESLLPHILPFLQDSDATIRWDALYAVGHLGNISYASYVEPLLSDTTRVEESAIFPSIGEDAQEILERWRTSIHLGGITWQFIGDRDE